MNNELPKWKEILKRLLVLIPIVALMFALLMGLDKVLIILFWGIILYASIAFIWLFVRLCNDVHKIASKLDEERE